MPRPYKVPAYKFFGTMAVIMSGFMVAMYCIPGSGGTLIAHEWGIVLAWCALGVVFFVFCKKKYRSHLVHLLSLFQMRMLQHLCRRQMRLNWIRLSMLQ